jgi:hypothetical protein
MYESSRADARQKAGFDQQNLFAKGQREYEDTQKEAERAKFESTLRAFPWTKDASAGVPAGQLDPAAARAALSAQPEPAKAPAPEDQPMPDDFAAQWETRLGLPAGSMKGKSLRQVIALANASKPEKTLDAPLTEEEANFLGLPPGAVGVPRRVAMARFTQGALDTRQGKDITSREGIASRSLAETKRVHDAEIDARTKAAAGRMTDPDREALKTIRAQIVRSFDEEEIGRLRAQADAVTGRYSAPARGSHPSGASPSDAQRLEEAGYRWDDDARGWIAPQDGR